MCVKPYCSPPPPTGWASLRTLLLVLFPHQAPGSSWRSWSQPWAAGRVWRVPRTASPPPCRGSWRGSFWRHSLSVRGVETGNGAACLRGFSSLFCSGVWGVRSCTARCKNHLHSNEFRLSALWNAACFFPHYVFTLAALVVCSHPNVELLNCGVRFLTLNPHE